MDIRQLKENKLKTILSDFDPKYYCNAVTDGNNDYRWLFYRKLCEKQCTGSNQSWTTNPICLFGSRTLCRCGWLCHSTTALRSKKKTKSI